ncbi:Heterokaryon incompatibility protein (HET) domain containing protein [Naviculisporaceae sp. PSN 640]
MVLRAAVYAHLLCCFQVQCQVCRTIVAAFQDVTWEDSWADLGTQEEVFEISSCVQHKRLIKEATNWDDCDAILEPDPEWTNWRVMRRIACVCLMSPIYRRPCSDGPMFTNINSGVLVLMEGSNVLDREWVNENLVRAWKNQCDEQHSAICQRFPGSVFENCWPLWVVDTAQECLVSGNGIKSYVGLSYVWGEVSMLKALRRNIHFLQSSHSLRSYCQGQEVIPATIRDAMQWVKVLGERYLWVDALCIVQDDEEVKQTEISKMSGIFANATLTLVASEGSDASSGLRGLKGVSKPRELKFRTFELGDAEIATFPKDQVPAESPWQERGWTFQEWVFSRRMLFFNFQGAYWRCWNASYDEERMLSKLPNPYSRFNEHVQNWEHLCSQKSMPDFPIISNLVSQYNHREFTYPEDCLFAFSGTANTLQHSLLGPFISGLPSCAFNIALLWQPWLKLESDNKYYACRDVPPRRRVASPSSKNADVCLPSWSWAGWQCLLMSPLWPALFEWIGRDRHDHFRVATTVCIEGLLWRYKMKSSPEEEGVAIEDLFQTYRRQYVAEDSIPCPRGWSRQPTSNKSADYESDRLTKHWVPQSPFCYKHVSDFHAEYRFPLPIEELREEPKNVPGMVFAPFIACRTWKSASLGYSEGQSPHSSSTAKSRWRGTTPDEPNSDDGGTFTTNCAALDVVMLSSGRYINCLPRDFIMDPFLIELLNELPSIPRPPIRPPEFYNILWVQWVDGVAYRKGLGKVRKHAWDSLEKQEIDLVLG